MDFSSYASNRHDLQLSVKNCVMAHPNHCMSLGHMRASHTRCFTNTLIKLLIFTKDILVFQVYNSYSRCYSFLFKLNFTLLRSLVIYFVICIGTRYGQAHGYENETTLKM